MSPPRPSVESDLLRYSRRLSPFPCAADWRKKKYVFYFFTLRVGEYYGLSDVHLRPDD